MTSFFVPRPFHDLVCHRCSPATSQHHLVGWLVWGLLTVGFFCLSEEEARNLSPAISFSPPSDGDRFWISRAGTVSWQPCWVLPLQWWRNEEVKRLRQEETAFVLLPRAQFVWQGRTSEVFLFLPVSDRCELTVPRRSHTPLLHPLWVFAKCHATECLSGSQAGRELAVGGG